MEKLDMNQFYDKCIKDALHSKANEIAPSSVLLDKISAEINSKIKENTSMNKDFKFRRMKPVVIATLVLILSAATCFAATQITSLVGTSTDAFDKFPTSQQVENAVNFVPDYIETFSNGFRFEKATIDNTQALDSDNNKVGEYKGITFFYTKEDAEKGQNMSLTIDPESPELIGEVGPNEEVITEGNFDLIYSKVAFKVVPEGYVPTEEEQEKMDQGVMWISYGSDKIETSDIQYVKWVKDGLSYNLMDQGYGLDKDEILEMAQEVI